jgi:Plasmid pRiA4b ORF-3-like protein
MTETVARLHITLSDTDPVIWRTVDVPVEANLKMLHDIIQAAMGWQDYHLWEFEAEGRRYGLPDPEWPDDSLTAAKNVKLKTLIDRGVRQLDYTYAMGDNWHHSIVIEAIGPGQPDTKYPRYIDGARRGPPEDCGGTPGLENFLEAIANPKHPDHAELIEWYAGCYGCTYAPHIIDKLVTKLHIGVIAKRRAAGKAAYAKRLNS